MSVAGAKNVFGLLSRRKMLTERQEALLEEVRRILLELREALARFGADIVPGDMRTLNDTIAHLDELFLLVEGARVSLQSVGKEGPGSRLFALAEQLLRNTPRRR